MYANERSDLFPGLTIGWDKMNWLRTGQSSNRGFVFEPEGDYEEDYTGMNKPWINNNTSKPRQNPSNNPSREDTGNSGVGNTGNGMSTQTLVMLVLLIGLAIFLAWKFSK